MTAATVQTSSALPVFEHQKRREWGLGILAWETSFKRGYLFENGQLRVLTKDFYHFMHEVDRPHDEVHALYACLRRDLETARADEGLTSLLPARSTRTNMSFGDQLAVFRADNPGGFEGVVWSQARRGTDVPKRVASHRDPAIAEAQAKLAQPELETRISQQQFRPICDDVLAVLRGTDLVSSAELAPFRSDDPEHRRALATAVADLLYGQTSFGRRFERFLAALDHAVQGSASWQLSTVLSALVHPSEHVCVHATSFREQAKWMAPRLTLPKRPTAVDYLRVLAMTKLVSTRLTAEAETPRDFMDVHDFIRTTTRPAAKKAAATLKLKESSPKGLAAKRAAAESQTGIG